jgi:hypothetical protein
MVVADPDEALIEAIAQAIHASACGVHDCDLCIRYPEAQDAARAAQAAMVEHLGLEEDRTFEWGETPYRRLVSRWTEVEP